VKERGWNSCPPSPGGGIDQTRVNAVLRASSPLRLSTPHPAKSSAVIRPNKKIGTLIENLVPRRVGRIERYLIEGGFLRLPVRYAGAPSVTVPLNVPRRMPLNSINKVV
jgi:hypothetical protein